MRYFLFALLLSPTSIFANPMTEIMCSGTTEMHNMLERSYGGQRTAWGMRAPEEVMEVWTDRRGDWAMVVRYANGTSCLVATGEDWTAIPTKESS